MVKIKKVIKKKVNKTEKLRKLLDSHHHNKLHKAKDIVKKNLLKPLKFSRLTLIILGIIVCIFILFLALNFIFIINLNKQLNQDLENLETKTNIKIEAISSSINTPGSSVDMPSQTVEVLNSFGDNFSGLSFIDQAKTNMNWDELVTAFTFPPIYSFEKVKDGFSTISQSNMAPRLTVIDNILYYRSRIVDLPPELKEENILNINVKLIGSRWLVGFVSGRTYDERAWVYFFDGKNFSPIITNSTSIRIEPKYERVGGTISFGGTEDNFLIVYGGYDGHAFYYYRGALTDISKFFSLRVSAGGFLPEILSRNNSRGTIFYICSLSDGKAKLIKFWPKRKGELMGALDFSPLIFTDTLGASSATCKFEEGANNVDNNNQSSNNSIRILMNVQKNDGTQETWRFTDSGFDNSSDREVTSFDIGQNRGRKIISAAIQAIDIARDGFNNNREEDEENPKAEIFLGNRENEWQKTKIEEWIKFEEPNESLFWRATFKAETGYPDYSPWFNHVNVLEYKTF